MKKVEKDNSLIKKLAFIFLILLALEIPVILLTRVGILSFGNSSNLNENVLEPSMMVLYRYNCIVCVCSLIVQAFYWGSKAVDVLSDKTKRKKFDKKAFVSNYWPCILLAVFMAWTSVGCIQASMEMNAEVAIKQATIDGTLEDLPDRERLQKIADWSSGDRMARWGKTKDNKEVRVPYIYGDADKRAWDGCQNLKDGYFSFLFYATVMLNVLMLGIGSENYKKWVIRAFLISSFVLGFVTLLAFFRRSIFAGIAFYDMSIFNNRNHFGYYITVMYIMSVCTFINEENYFFKPFAFINTLLYTWLMFACNTFGIYLGILFAMIFLGIAMLIGTISNIIHKTTDEDKTKNEYAVKYSIPRFVQYLVCLVIFLFVSFTFVKAKAEMRSVKLDPSQEDGLGFDYSYVIMTFGDNSYMYSFNTLSEELAESIGINGKVVNSENIPILFGKKVTKLENRQTPFVEYELINKLRDGFIKLLSFFKQEEIKLPIDNNANSGEKTSSGETTDYIDLLKGLSQQEALNKISERYPKVSGESYEEWSTRQAKIEEDFQKFKERFPEEKEVKFEDLSDVGSGRAKVWIRSLDLMNERPIFGWGLENILQEFNQQFKVNEGRTHNLILQLGATAGIPAVLMYLVAVISLWVKVLFDSKFKKYDKMQLYIICAVYLVATIILNVVVSKVVDKLLFNGLFTVILWAILTIVFFARDIHLRITKWNEFELVSATVFVSYMISSMFGNSAFYTSPYFMVFLGLLAHEAMHKEKVIEKTKD